MSDAAKPAEEGGAGDGPLSALARLTDVSRALTYAVSLDEVLDITVECAADLLDADRVVLMLRGDDDLLRVRASRGVETAAVERFAEPMDETLVGRLGDLLGPEAQKRFLGVPLVVRGDVTGLVAVLVRGGDTPADRQEWLLSALADQASVALENARQERTRSELEQRLDDLDRTDDNRDDALRIVSHELKSPLSALNGYLHLLVTGSYGAMNEAQTATVERLQAISEHVASVVTNVMEMGWLSTGSLELETAPVELAPLVENAVAVLGPAPSEEGVEVETRVEPGLVVRAHADRLRQVLVQLLDNAVKHAPRQTEVVVSAEADGEGVAIRVSDQGPGVPADKAEAIFEPYTRLGSETTPGMGLGLAIARGLVERMGGSLRLDGEAAGGATFVLRLPAA